MPQRDCQVRLADPGRTDEHDILSALDEGVSSRAQSRTGACYGAVTAASMRFSRNPTTVCAQEGEAKCSRA